MPRFSLVHPGPAVRVLGVAPSLSDPGRRGETQRLADSVVRIGTNFVNGPRTMPLELAATIVHEWAHAMLNREAKLIGGSDVGELYQALDANLPGLKFQDASGELRNVVTDRKSIPTARRGCCSCCKSDVFQGVC